MMRCTQDRAWIRFFGLGDVCRGGYLIIYIYVYGCMCVYSPHGVACVMRTMCSVSLDVLS